MPKRALITGCTGQDGFFLAQHLLSLGYEVIGLSRRRKIDPQDMVEGVRYVTGSVQDASCVHDLLVHEKPDEIYNLAAEAFVPDSWTGPWLVFQVNVQGVLNFLESMVRIGSKAKFFQAGSSEMYGDSPPPQNEDTPMRPLSPYGASKTAAYHLVRQYRMGYGLFACNAVTFNHESVRRLPCFVTRHVTQGVAAIAERKTSLLQIGNLSQVRDWGHSRDYVKAMYLMLQQEEPDDYVLATGVSRTVRQLVDYAFSVIGKSPDDYLVETPERYRRNDNLVLRGDATKSRTVLGWKPETTFEAMIEEMIECDRVAIRRDLAKMP